MIPCNNCGKFCGNSCLDGNKWSKAVHFASTYGGGVGKFSSKSSDLYDFMVGEDGNMITNKPLKQEGKPNGYTVPCSCGGPDKPNSCLIHQDQKLKWYTASNEGCPECHNMTWALGWHFPGCKYHLPKEHCPVSGHPECKATPPPPPTPVKNVLEGKSIQFHVMDEAALMPEQPKYKHSLYGPQITRYAQHHNITRKQAWDETIGAAANALGWDWPNPYYSLSPLHATASTPAEWPDLLSKHSVCSCKLCTSQKKNLIPEKKMVNTDFSSVELQAAQYYTSGSQQTPAQATAAEIFKTMKELVDKKGAPKGFAKGGMMIKNDPPVDISLKNFSDEFDKFTESDDDADDYVLQLNEPTLVLITGLKNAPMSTVFNKAQALFEEFLEIDEDDDQYWLSKKFGEAHPQFTLKSDANTATYPAQAGKISFFPDIGEVVASGKVQSWKPMTATLQANNVSPETLAVATGSQVKTLKPGDQVIVTVDKEGQLVIPPGMNALVIPK